MHPFFKWACKTNVCHLHTSGHSDHMEVASNSPLFKGASKTNVCSPYTSGPRDHMELASHAYFFPWVSSTNLCQSAMHPFSNVAVGNDHFPQLHEKTDVLYPDITLSLESLHET